MINQTELVQHAEAAPAQVIKLDPEALIAKGIEHGISVEGLERLLAMRERLKAEQSRSAYVRAIAEFQGSCPIIVKDQVVRDKYGKERYRYAPLDSIIKQVGPMLRGNGLTYRMDTRIEQDTALVATCFITHMEGHAESSEFRVPIDRDSYMSEPQKFGAASTYAKRYAFCNALGILTGDQDTDAHKDDGRRAKTAVEMSCDTEGPRDPVDVDEAGIKMMELLAAEDAAGLSAYSRTLDTGIQLAVWNRLDSKQRRRIKEFISVARANVEGNNHTDQGGQP